MKTRLSIALLATAVSLAACTGQLTPQFIDDSRKAVSIQPVGSTAMTKAGPIDGTVFPNSYNMVVSAYYNAAEGESTNYFSGITFSRNASTGRWDESKYWPMSGTLNLLAYSVNDGTSNVVSAAPVYSAKNTDGVTLTVTDNRTAQVDILHSQVEEKVWEATGVPMQFKHAQAAVAFVAKSNVAYNAARNEGITITKITLNDAKYSGTLAISKAEAAGTAPENGYCVWTALGSQAAKDLSGVGAGYNVPAAYLDVTSAGNHFGIGATGIMVPEQAQTSFTIEYTMHNGFEANGTTKNDITGMKYTHTCSDNWIEGKKYVYELNFTLNKIEVTPTVLDWNTDSGFDPNVPIPFKANALKFSCPVEQTLKLNTQIAETDRPNLEYSYDGRVWNTAPFNTSIAFGNDQELYLRGSSGTFSQNNLKKINIEFGFNDTSHPVTCEGNIQHLLKYNEEYNEVPESCFYELFQNQRCLIQAPELPATTLTRSCYLSMFQGCTSLTSAPELPATTLAISCYQSMFYGCTYMTSAPELPATSLVERCYNNMFNGCTSLTSAPELPATTLAISCYQSMFQGCTSLTSAPELPATTLAGSCYNNMFNGCTSLTNAPELPATTLAIYCYSNMFNGCTSLTSAPELPATTLANACYQSMFYGCTSLTSAPELPATTLANSCYYYMFQGCSNLNYIKAAFITITSSNNFRWVEGVSSSGTFVKNAAATWNISGSDGIPAGWTVETYNP